MGGGKLPPPGRLNRLPPLLPGSRRLTKLAVPRAESQRRKAQALYARATARQGVDQSPVLSRSDSSELEASAELRSAASNRMTNPHDVDWKSYTDEDDDYLSSVDSGHAEYMARAMEVFAALRDGAPTSTKRVDTGIPVSTSEQVEDSCSLPKESGKKTRDAKHLSALSLAQRTWENIPGHRKLAYGKPPEWFMHQYGAKRWMFQRKAKTLPSTLKALTLCVRLNWHLALRNGVDASYHKTAVVDCDRRTLSGWSLPRVLRTTCRRFGTPFTT